LFRTPPAIGRKNPFSVPLVAVLLFVPAHLQAGYEEQTRRPDPPLKIPALADFAGVKVGYHSMARLERHLGPGDVVTGGHPRGARTWSDRRKGAWVLADGFEYRTGRPGDSAVIDTITVGQTRSWPVSRCFASPRRQSHIGWHGISLGMTREAVLRRVFNMLPQPRMKASSLRWEDRGFVRVNASTTYRTWFADLDFEHDRLSKIHLTCE
jgi:hypothetical protein